MVSGRRPNYIKKLSYPLFLAKFEAWSPSGAEPSHPGLGPEPVADLERQALPDLLVGQRGQVVEAQQGVGQRRLAHTLLTEHHKARPEKGQILVPLVLHRVDLLACLGQPETPDYIQ